MSQWLHKRVADDLIIISNKDFTISTVKTHNGVVLKRTEVFHSIVALKRLMMFLIVLRISSYIVSWYTLNKLLPIINDYSTSTNYALFMIIHSGV